jgi:hypothetical protein
MNRRLMLSTVLAGSATAILTPVVFADADWCDDDPMVRIMTPTGLVLPVNITNYALGNHLGALKMVHNNPTAPFINYTVEAVKGKGPSGDNGLGSGNANGRHTAQEWEVNMTIVIPGHPIAGDAVEGKFKVKTVVSTEPNASGTILARGEGWSDKPMRVRFTFTI